MCFYDAERPVAFDAVIRKARRDHRCCECGETITRGEKYEYASGIWEGIGPDSFKTCMGCVSLRDAVVAAEYADGCHGSEAVPPFGHLWNAAHEMDVVSRVRQAVEGE